MRNQNTPIAMEGLPFILGFGGGSFLCYLIAASAHVTPAYIPAGLLLLLSVFSVFFFRNPHRESSADEGAVIAPADGQVIFLGEAKEEHTGEMMMKVSIFMSVFNVHINRVPLTGRLIDNFYVKGKFFDVRDQRASFENERNGLVIETAKGVRLVVVQVAGLIARRIVCYPRVGDMVLRGDRYGLIRFGSRLDVFMPLQSEIKVSLGEKTVCGETVLGLLP